MTALVKEFDMDENGKGAKLTESIDILGVSSMPSVGLRQGQSSKFEYNRIVMKTNKQEAASGSINIKHSLLKK